MPRFTVTSVTDSVDKELAALAERGAEVGALGALAREMATQLDAPDVSATAKASCGRVLLDAMERIVATAPEAEQEDALDGLAGKLAAKLAQATKAS